MSSSCSAGGCSIRRRTIPIPHCSMRRACVDRVLDALIDRKLVQQVAEEAGFRVSEAMLNQIIL